MLIRKWIYISQKIRYNFCISKIKKQKTHYQILQIPTSATPTNIKKNYIKLAKIYHPDLYKGSDKTRFSKIQQAYKILSNQSDRNNYDQSIGIKNNQQTQTQTQQQNNNNQNTINKKYGKPTNNFKYTKPKVDINIDQQYQKFFKKQSTTNYQQIRLHQQTQFKSMNQKQRIRRRFTQIYSDNQDLKMMYSKSYKEILNDQINQKNRYQQDLQKRKQQNQKKNTKQYIQKQRKYIKRGAVIVFIIMLPFILSFRTKLILDRQAQKQYQQCMNYILEEMELSQVKSRLQF